MLSSRINSNIFLILVGIFSQGDALGIRSLDEQDTPSGTLNSLNPVRKCCSEEQFYNVISHECEVISKSLQYFNTNVKELFTRGKNVEFTIIPGRITSCPETGDNPYTDVVASADSHTLLHNGSIKDTRNNHYYDRFNYCLEMVGDRIESASLVLAYCPGKQDLVPKCCPQDQYFDESSNECSSDGLHNETNGDLSVGSYLSEGHILTYEGDLTCTDIPIRINMKETKFKGNKICIDKIEECYRVGKYCVDEIKTEVDRVFEPSVYACPDFFINKCCPEQRNLHKTGCVEAERHSLSMLHFLKNFRYQIKGVSEQGSKCSPFTIEDNSRSDIKWDINSYGLAVIAIKDDVIHTRNFCIDDFLEDGDVFPVLKVCSEEVKVYHEVSSLEKWTNAVGKCCPINKIFHPNVTADTEAPSCVHLKDYDPDFSIKNALLAKNVSKLVFSHFPTCEDGNYYHHYHLSETKSESAILNKDQTLTIREGCKQNGVTMNKLDFCVDFMTFNDVLNPVAIVCAPSDKNFHLERNSLIALLVGVSCVALFITLVTLILMRVRRGMITVKKVNTLAGKTLISYVFSQLIGYLVLCVLTLADFAQNTLTCLVLSGFLLFFITAAFFWNCSICVECLLLTLQVKMSGQRRFLCYNLFSWGVPLSLTILALVKDSQTENCGTISPKFGVDRCFFSDQLAQILYFYLPITLTVLLNVVLLITAKILRRTKLKELDKDPNRPRRHGTIKKVFSKSQNGGKQSEQNKKSGHSGLRAHLHNNIWLESVKLVMWSGITWLMELVGALVSIYVGRPKGEWYHYLWYLPVLCNCLRGIGIFILIVITTDNKIKFVNTMRHVHSNFNYNMSRVLTTVRFKDENSKQYSKTVQKKSKTSKKSKRSESVSTVITCVSGSPSDSTITSTDPKESFFHSVSQYEIPNFYGEPDELDIVDFKKSSEIIYYLDETADKENDDECSIDFDNQDYCTHL